MINIIKNNNALAFSCYCHSVPTYILMFLHNNKGFTRTSKLVFQSQSQTREERVKQGKNGLTNSKPGVPTKMRPRNNVMYGTLRYTLQAIRCCASYILLNRLGLGINSEFLCH